MTLLYHLWHSKWKLEKSVGHYLPDHPKCSSPMFFDDRTASRQYFVQHAGENAAFELGSCSWGRSVQSQERCGLKLTYIPTFTGFQSGEYWSRNMPIILFQSFTDAVIHQIFIEHLLCGCWAMNWIPKIETLVVNKWTLCLVSNNLNACIFLQREWWKNTHLSFYQLSPPFVKILIISLPWVSFNMVIVIKYLIEKAIHCILYILKY